MSHCKFSLKYVSTFISNSEAFHIVLSFLAYSRYILIFHTTGSTKLMDKLNKKKSKRIEKTSEGTEEKNQGSNQLEELKKLND